VGIAVTGVSWVMVAACVGSWVSVSGGVYVLGGGGGKDGGQKENGKL